MDKVFVNGIIHSFDKENRTHGAVGVNGERIVALGEEADLRKRTGRRTEIVDLAGGVLFPGFIDSHTHFMMFAYLLQGLNLADPSIRKMDNILGLVKAAAGKVPAGQWIRGSRFVEYFLAEKRYPTRHDLDVVSPDHPVILYHTSFHACVVNSKGLKALGLTRETSDPEGGTIERDPATGEPNGVLHEAAMLNLAFKALFPMDLRAMTESERLSMCLQAMAKYNEVGVVSVSDCLVTPDTLSIYQDVFATGQSTLRVYLMPELLVSEGLISSGIKTDLGSEWLRIGPIKIFEDGGMSNRSAAISTPYLTPPYGRGVKIMPREAMIAAVKRVHDQGFQISVHCQGDDGLADTLDAFENVLGTRSSNPRRHRIEHAGCLYPPLLKRAAAMGIGICVQPVFLSFLGDGYIDAFGRAGADQIYPFRSMLDAGIALSGGSDCPVSLHDPRLSFRDAVLRRTTSGEVIGPEQTVTMDEVMRMFTSGSAYLNREDHITGTIELGKRADFTVLADDPRRVPAEEVPDLPVRMTVVGGRVVYSGS